MTDDKGIHLDPSDNFFYSFKRIRTVKWRLKFILIVSANKTRTGSLSIYEGGKGKEEKGITSKIPSIYEDLVCLYQKLAS